MTNEKLYKYYFFYLKTEGYKPELYAYTDNKELADEFEIERNMDLFVKKKHKITRGAVNDLAQEYPELAIELIDGVTKSNDNISHTVKFSMAVTAVERMSIVTEFNNVVFYQLLSLSSIDPRAFKPSIQKSLNIIDYTYNYYTYHLEASIPDDVYEYQYCYDMDLFGVFVNLYGKLLRNSGD
jgi:hypothetical protein